MKDILICENGNVRNGNVSELLHDCDYEIKDILINILKTELACNPDGELITLISQVMEAIANKEIDKVLES